MWIFVAAIAVLALLYVKSNSYHKLWTKRGVLQPNTWPIFGNVAPVAFRMCSFTDIVHDLYKRFPNERYSGVYQFYRPALMVRCPELIKQIMVKYFDSFPEHRLSLPKEGDPLFGDNLFTMRGGQRWHDLRATLSPSFTSSKLKGMFSLMQECATQCINHFQKHNQPVSVEMKDLFTRYTNDVIGTSAFGVTCNSFENPDNEFFLMGKEATNMSPLRILKLLMASLGPTIMQLIKPRLIPLHVETFFRALISDSLKLRKSQRIVRPDMINLMLEAQKTKPEIALTDEEITAQAFIFFLAGFETASTAMCFTAYELAINQDVQKKLQDEIDGATNLTYESLLELKYMDMVISESLRKWPPVMFTDRRSVKPFTIEAKNPGEKDIYLEKFSDLWIPIFGLHRDPKYYPDPETFDPERFSDPHNVNHDAYIPFGLGPRNCIGSRFALLEVKLILFYILRCFDIEPEVRTPKKVVLDPKRLFPSVEGGLWLKFKPRNGVNEVNI